MTASQNAGKSGPLRPTPPLAVRRNGMRSLNKADPDRARHRPLHRHRRAHRADHLAGRGPHPQAVKRDEMRHRNRKRRDDRNGENAIRHRDIGERDERHPDDIEQRHDDADAFGAEPIEPAEPYSRF